MMNTKSFKTEVQIDGEWASNALRFATQAEAEASVKELLSRWFAPYGSRVTEVNDSPNYHFDFKLNKNIKGLVKH